MDNEQGVMDDEQGIMEDKQGAMDNEQGAMDDEQVVMDEEHIHEFNHSSLAVHQLLLEIINVPILLHFHLFVRF